MTPEIELVCGHDPGASGCGYAVWKVSASELIYVSAEPPKFAVHVAVVESGFIGKMGKKAMWGLGFAARGGLDLVTAAERFTIRPDGKNGWRANLPKRPGTFQEYDGLPGEVIVNRLRARYGYDIGAHSTEHQIEACGIAEAAAAILQRPKAKDRKALVRVKR